MRKLLLIINIIFAVLFVSCEDSSEKEVDSFDYNKIAAEWKLIEWADTPAEMDVYIEFNIKKTFTIYQQTESVRFVKFTGIYSVKGDVISGSYSDGTAWGSSYILNVEGETMTMVSKTDIAEINTYAKTVIPAEVKEEAENNIQSKSLGIKRLL